MPSPVEFMNLIEGALKDANFEHPHFDYWWGELKNAVEDAYPHLAYSNFFHDSCTRQDQIGEKW